MTRFTLQLVPKAKVMTQADLKAVVTATFAQALLAGGWDTQASRSIAVVEKPYRQP